MIAKVADEPAALLFASSERGRLRDVAEQIGIHRRDSLVDAPPDLLDGVTRDLERLRHLLVSFVQDCPTEHPLFGRGKMEARHLRLEQGRQRRAGQPALRILTIQPCEERTLGERRWTMPGLRVKPCVVILRKKAAGRQECQLLRTVNLLQDAADVIARVCQTESLLGDTDRCERPRVGRRRCAGGEVQDQQVQRPDELARRT